VAGKTSTPVQAKTSRARVAEAHWGFPREKTPPGGQWDGKNRGQLKNKKRGKREEAQRKRKPDQTTTRAAKTSPHQGKGSLNIFTCAPLKKKNGAQTTVGPKAAQWRRKGDRRRGRERRSRGGDVREKRRRTAKEEGEVKLSET